MLTQIFTLEFKHQVKLDLIYAYQELSEAFILMNEDVLNWSIILRHQKLSQKFIADNSERLDATKIYEYRELNKEFFGKYNHEINWCNPEVHKNLSDGRINVILLSQICKTIKELKKIKWFKILN